MDMMLEFERTRNLVEKSLETLFTENLAPKGLLEAMRYSLLAGGKRIRPVMVLQFCLACGGDAKQAMPAACAVELLHTYSLIHDDLPCMDDDDLRRGQPTNHKVFGECTATLAGDALQAAAFEILLDSPLPSERVVKMGQVLAHAAGVYGICGGQVMDMAAEGKKLPGEEVRRIHDMKTAAMLDAAAKLGVLAAGGDDEKLKAAEKYAMAIGLAFQVRDDILDRTATTQQLGKPVGSDEKNMKSTFVTIYGIDECERIISDETEKALSAIDGVFENTEFLTWLAGYLAERKC